MAGIIATLRRLWEHIYTHHTRHLSARLMLYMLLIGLMPVLIAGYVINLQFESNLIAQTEQDLTRRLNGVNNGIENYLRTQEKNLRTLAFTPTLQIAMTEFEAAYAAEGAEGIAIQEIEDKYLDFLAAYVENNFYTDIYLISTQGDVLISLLHGEEHGINLNSAAWSGGQINQVYRQSLTQIQAITSLPEMKNDQDIFFYVASPVIEENHVKGSVIIKINMQNLQTYYLDTLQFTQDVRMIAAHYDAEKWQRIFLRGLQNEPVLSEWELSSLQQHKVQMGDMLHMQQYFEVAAYLPSFSAYIVLGVPQQFVMAVVQRTKLLVLVFMLISGLIIALLASRLASNFTRPIKELGLSCEALGHGAKQVSVAIERSDEIGHLARQFNDMADNLQKTKTQLVQTEKLASIGHLAAGVAHEINNPMGIVTANVASLEEYTETLIKFSQIIALQTNHIDESNVDSTLKNMQDYYRKKDMKFVCEDVNILLDETQQNLKRVRDIVSSMQVFSEIDKESETNCDSSALMDSSLVDLKPQMPTSIKLLREYSSNICAQGRPKQLKRAFSHVLDNALKALVSKEKGILRVRIRTREGVVVINIDDNGEGIIGENKDKIFNPFFTTRKVGHGIGMGLAVTYSIITAHGGEIQVQSAEGKGTRISIRLPLSPSQ